MKKITIFLFLCLMFSSSFSQWQPGGPITDTRDGKVYKTVVIGAQVWMAENLNFGTMIPSNTQGYQMSDNGAVEKYCWENNQANCDGTGGLMKRGAFYEWKEAMQFWSGQPEAPVRGICPEGWHIPSNSEWNTLISYLGGGAEAGAKMLEGGSSGFEALLTGYRCTMTGGFRVSAMSADTRTYFWTSEQQDAENAPLLELGASSFTSFAFYKSLGLSVRCIWDGEPSEVRPEGETGQNIIEMSVAPNPSSGIAVIKYKLNSDSPKEAAIYIGNILGERVAEVFKGSLGAGEFSKEIDTGKFAAGMYFLTAYIGGEAMQIKVIIEK